MQSVGGIGGKPPLKTAEGHGAVIEIAGIFHFFQTEGMVDKGENAPKVM